MPLLEAALSCIFWRDDWDDSNNTASERLASSDDCFGASSIRDGENEFFRDFFLMSVCLCGGLAGGGNDLSKSSPVNCLGDFDVGDGKGGGGGREAFVFRGGGGGGVIGGGVCVVVCDFLWDVMMLPSIFMLTNGGDQWARVVHIVLISKWPHLFNHHS